LCALENPQIKRIRRFPPVAAAMGDGQVKVQSVRISPHERVTGKSAITLSLGGNTMVRGSEVPFETGHVAGRMLLSGDECRWATQVQIQGRFKQACNDLWMWVELPTAPKLNWFTMGIAKLLIGLIKRTSGGRFSFSLGDDGGRPHLTFPVGLVCTCVSTVPGDEPFKLGGPELSAAENEGQGPTAVSMGQTITLMFQSSFIDLDGWQLLNVPGVGQMPLERLLGELNSMSVVVYDALADHPYPKNGGGALMAGSLLRGKCSDAGHKQSSPIVTHESCSDLAIGL